MAPDLSRIGALGQLRSQQQAVVQQSPLRSPLTEYAALLAIPGRTWAMATFPQPSLKQLTSSPAVTHELAAQFSEPPRQFMILTNVGLTFLVKRRALDYLKAVIEDVQSEGNLQPLIEFRDR
jgi:nuclear pore complex protein Nup155